MKPVHAHVVGVAGVGMSAIAQALVDQGFDVTGSDRFLDSGDRLEVLDQLERAGVMLLPQDGSGVRADTQAVVVSTAIEAGNPDLDAAIKHGVEIVHRAAMLARLVEGAQTIAVTGTAGKTTVTAMIGWILQQLEADPAVVNGGAVTNWSAADRVGNTRKGRGDVWVIEADESDRSLLQFHPDWGVVTNISKDHFDEAEVIELFRSFSAQVRCGVVCGAGVKEVLKENTDGAGTSYHEVQAHQHVVNGAWEVVWRDQSSRIPMPGRHNALNAAMAFEAVFQLGHDPADIVKAFEGFLGVQRRLEVVGRAGDIEVIDDYAHNPAKILATWQAVSETRRRILGIWRPHGFRPLAHMMDELIEAMVHASRPGDRLYVLPVFYSGGTASAEVTSEDLVRGLVERDVSAHAVESYGSLEKSIRDEARAGDAIVVMGARDPGLRRFAHSIADHFLAAPPHA